jgi:hypothetical protein
MQLPFYIIENIHIPQTFGKQVVKVKFVITI